MTGIDWLIRHAVCRPGDLHLRRYHHVHPAAEQVSPTTLIFCFFVSSVLPVQSELLLSCQSGGGGGGKAKIKSVLWNRIRIQVISWIRNRIRIRICLQMKSQNVWNMRQYEHFFKGLSLYSEARIWIRILITHQGEKSDPDPHQIKIRIRIRIRVISRIRIRIGIRIKMMQIHCTKLNIIKDVFYQVPRVLSAVSCSPQYKIVFFTRWTMIGYGSLGALIFSLYLVYDTQLMLGGKHKYSLRY